MAYYSTEYGPTAEPTPKQLYDWQLQCTGDLAAKVKAEIDRLQKLPEFQLKDSAASMKFQYLDVQFSVYDGIVKQITSFDTLMQRQVAMGNSSQAPAHRIIYSEMHSLLQDIEVRFRRALRMPDSWFKAMMARVQQDLADWVQKNPETTAGILGGAAAVTATGATAYRCYFGICVLGEFFGAECAAWSMAATVSSSLAVGALVGLVVLAVVWHIIPRPKEEVRRLEREQREQLEALVKRLSETPLEQIQPDLRKLRDLFGLATFMPDADDHCLVCLESFHNEAGEAVRDFTLAPGCGGRHFMCPGCWDEVVQSRTWQTQECPTCRH